MNPSITLRTKVIAYVAVWLLAFFAANPTGSLWPLAYLFPIGLLQVFYRPALRDGAWSTLILCFAVYLGHAFFYFRSRTKRSTIIWFVILVLLLVCNVSGCRAMINTH
jgi:hypothetical protein